MTDPELIAALDQLEATMIAVATGGPRIDSVLGEFRQTFDTVESELQGRGITLPAELNRNLWQWYGRWSRGDLPTYASRRAFVASLFQPLVKRVRDAGTKPVAGYGSGGYGTGPYGQPPSGLPAAIAGYSSEPGLTPESPPPSDFQGMTIGEAAQRIRDWFLQNYEDPVHSTSYDGREGGYQYVYGPYRSRSIIRSTFNMPDEIIETALDLIEDEGGPEWTAAQHRVIPDDIEPPESAAEIHARMLARIDELEAALASLPPPPPGIGHNNPPSEVEDVPLSSEDRRQVGLALATLKGQPPDPVPRSPVVIQAVEVLQTLARKALDYTVKQADNFVSEMVKTAGRQTATAMTVSLTVGWQPVVDLLQSVAQLAVRWLGAG